MGRLEQNLDVALIHRIDAGIKPRGEPTLTKRNKPPRTAASYRAAQRNNVLRGDIKQTWPGAKPDAVLHQGRNHYSVKRFGRFESRPLTYRPNGQRECARRAKVFSVSGR